jgi:integrase/recombinase XerD
MITVKLHWKKRSKGSTGYLVIRGEGETVWERIGLQLTGDKKIDKDIIAAAERIRAKRLIEIVEQGYNIPSINANKDFLQFYKTVIDERPEYERRAAVYKNLTEFSNKNNERITFKDLNENFWNRFKNFLVEEKGYAKFTIHTILSIIKAVLNRSVRDKVISKNPLSNVKEKRPDSTRTYLTWEELQTLYETPCVHDVVKRAFVFSCYTGLRLSDIEALRKKYFWEDRIVIPSMEKTKDSVIIDYDKSLLEYIPDFDGFNDEDLVFSLPARSTIHTTIKEWAFAAGIKKNISYHTSRHTFGTGLLTYGGDIATAQKLLGHRDIRDTMIYAKIIDEKRKSAINNLPKLRK